MKRSSSDALGEISPVLHLFLMNNHHYQNDEEDDDEDTDVRLDIAAPVSRGYNLHLDDDAFGDDEDMDVTLGKFTPEAIREEMAKNFSASREAELDVIASKIGYAVDPDASVSTFDIDAPADEAPRPSLGTPPLQPSTSSRSQFHSQDSPTLDNMEDISLSNSYSHISLSDDKSLTSLPSPPAVHSDHEDESDDHAQYANYPTVQIDVSESIPTPHEIRLSAVSAQGTSMTIHPGSSSRSIGNGFEQDQDRPTTPSSSRLSPAYSAASTSSLPLPSSSSAPVPSTSASHVSIAANLPRHRGTRSVGPSALDKVISKTRPSFLPPKDRSEDRKHMADWESMMKRSRAAGES